MSDANIKSAKSLLLEEIDAVNHTPPRPTVSPAARFDVVMYLLKPPIYCDCGCGKIIGYDKPLIDKETFLKLLAGEAPDGDLPNPDKPAKLSP